MTGVRGPPGPEGKGVPGPMGLPGCCHLRGFESLPERLFSRVSWFCLGFRVTVWGLGFRVLLDHLGTGSSWY